MAVFAHPDDETLVAGGTLAACAAAGREVVIVSLTRGELGPIARPELATRESLGAVRESELRAAGRALGAHAVECLGFPDGALGWADEAEVGARLSELIGRWRPGIVVTFGPEGLYWHPDHVAAHRLTSAALETAAGTGFSPWVYHATWPSGLAQGLIDALDARGTESSLWGLSPASFGAPPESITTRLDVRDFLDAKLRALACHRTQMIDGSPLMGLPRDLSEVFLGTEYFALAGAPAGGGEPLTGVVSAARARASELSV